MKRPYRRSHSRFAGDWSHERKLTRAFALGFVLGISGVLGACVTAPPPEQSIIDAVAAGSLAQPSSCEARGATDHVRADDATESAKGLQLRE